jgi:hypothetical protein
MPREVLASSSRSCFSGRNDIGYDNGQSVRISVGIPAHSVSNILDHLGLGLVGIHLSSGSDIFDNARFVQLLDHLEQLEI